MKLESGFFHIALFALWGGVPGQCRNPEESCAVCGDVTLSFPSHRSHNRTCPTPGRAGGGSIGGGGGGDGGDRVLTIAQISPKAIVSDACASYSTLDGVNRDVKPVLDDLTRSTDFFSHYRLNLFNKKCPFWDDDNGLCGNQACAVLTLDDENDIPEVWRASELSKLEGPLAKHPGRQAREERRQRPLRGELGEGVGESCVVEYDDECDDRDYCVPEDESAASKGNYVSLLQNPERFTGYSGAGARQVWDTIYRENCFQKSSFPSSAGLGTSQWQQGGGLGVAAHDFRQVLEAAGRQELAEQHRQHSALAPFAAQTGLGLEDECLEKRVFYRVISGMHASISTHLCWDFFNQTTGEWHPNPQCYRERLHGFPERISNLYFNYALVTRAVAKLGPYLRDPARYTFCTGDPEQDARTRAMVADVAGRAAAAPPLFDESLMFKNGEGPSLKEDFRQRFRNVSRLMDCVGCDKCRLWGKIQTSGYGTALKVLFEMDNHASGEPPRLKRTELVALFNTYARISSSVHVIGKFKDMVAEDAGSFAESFAGSFAGSSAAAAVASAASASAASASAVVRDGAEDRASRNGAREPRIVGPGPPVEGTGEEAFEKQRYPSAEDGLRAIFSTELRRIVNAFRFVLRSWINAPATAWNIISSEVVRMWQFWIGTPISPRTWSIEVPNVDSL